MAKPRNRGRNMTVRVPPDLPMAVKHEGEKRGMQLSEVTIEALSLWLKARLEAEPAS